MKHSVAETVSSAINGSLTVEQLYRVALEKSLAFSNCTTGAIVLVNRAISNLSIKARIVDGQWLTDDCDLNLDLFQSLIKQVITIRRTVNYPDIRTVPELAMTLREDSLCSLLVVPIAIEARVLGILAIESDRPNAFSFEHEQFLTIIGSQIVLAIDTHTLRSINMELSTLPVEKILPRIAEAACLLFAARSSAFLLTDNHASEKICGARYPETDTDDPFIPRVNGLTFELIASRKPLIVRDVQQDSRVKPSTKKRGIQSILGVPLQMIRKNNEDVEVRTIGALWVDLVEDRTFSEHEQMLLQSLANQAMVAIERARHTEALHRLNQSYFAITSSQMTFFDLANKVLLEAIKLVNAKGGRLCLLDKTGKEVQWAVMSNFQENPVQIKMEATVGVFGEVVKARQPFAIPNYNKWANRRTSFDKYGFTAVAGVPILLQDYFWGVILVHDTVDGRIFTQEELDLLASLGSFAAVAFSNASKMDDLARIIESSSSAVIAVDDSGRITQFNRQTEEMLQYKKEEVFGKSIIDIYYEEGEAQRIKRMLVDDPGGQIEDYMTFLRSKKGQKIPIKLSASLLYDFKDKKAGSVGFFQDQRRNEARLAVAGLLDKTELFQAIVDQAAKITGAAHAAYITLNSEHKLRITITSSLDSSLKNSSPVIDLEHDARIGISGRAFRTGVSQLVHDVSLDSDYIVFDPKTRSELAVPVKIQGEVIGVIDVEYPNKAAFTEADKYNLEMLAQFAAHAIHNSQLYAESQKDKLRFATIAEIVREAAQSTAIDQLFRNTSHRLEEIFKEKKAVASIRLYDKANNVLRFERTWHESYHQRTDNKAQRVQVIQNVDEGICGLVIKTRRSQNVGDVNKHPNYLRIISNTQSEIAVPIHLDEARDLIGVLDIQSPSLNAFNESDLKYLELLAGHLAIDIDKAQLVIDKAQLAERERKGSDVKEALMRAHGAVIGPADLQETLDQVTQQVYKLAQAREIRINSVVLRVVQGSKRILAAAQPPELLSNLKENLAEIVIIDGVNGKKGISGRAILSGETQRVGEVSSDPDYLLLNASTQSELAIPIRVNGKVIAAMDIESAAMDDFDEDDQQIFEALAAQAGIAIHGAYQYIALDRRSRHQEAVYQASQIISRSIAVDQSDLLRRILEQAVERILLAGDRKANYGVIQLYNAATKELRREAIYPLEVLQEWESKLGDTRMVGTHVESQIGIMGRAVLEQRAQRVADVSQDSDYVCISESTRSELDVPMFDEDGNVLGVLGLESDKLAAFDEEDERALQNLADLAVIAIRNSQRYQELEETKAALATHAAIAWLAADRSSWQHKIVGHLGALDTYIKLMEHDLATDAFEEKLKERLTKIKIIMEKTREKRIAQPLSPDEGLELVHADNFITQWLDKIYWDPDLFSDLVHEFQPDCGDAYIKVHPGWFKLALDNIVNNALRAMEESSIKKLTIKTDLVDKMVEITISDTGKGIDPQILPMLGKAIIKKGRNSPGEGIGQILSRMILKTYEGEIKVLSTSSSGTSILIRLPRRYQ